MSSMMKIALVGFSAILFLFPSLVTSASIADRNSLDWQHLISKRGTENITETKETEVTKDQTIEENTKTELTNSEIEPMKTNEEEQNNNEQLLDNSRTIDWNLLDDGNTDDLNDELTARRKRRSIVAARVADKLASVRNENRVRSKRDLSLDDDGTGLDDNDIEDLEALIYRLQKINENRGVDDIDTDDLAYGSDSDDGDSAVYFQPVVVESDDDGDDSALLAQLLDTPNADEDDDNVDDDDDVDEYRPKDKRSYPVIDDTDDGDDDDDDDNNEETSVGPVLGYVGYPVIVDDDNDGQDDDDDADVEEAPVMTYMKREVDDDVSRQLRVKLLERRIKELAQYLNEQYRKR